MWRCQEFLCYNIEIIRRWLISASTLIAIALVLLSAGQPIVKQEAGPTHHYNVAEQSPTPSIDTPTNPHAEIKQDSSNAEPDSGPNWSNWALVLVGMGGIGIALRTLIEIAKQARVMRHQSAISRYQTKATARAAKATEDSVELAADTAQRQLRAYVCLSVALMKFYGPNQFEAQLTFKNSGQTPAYKVDHRILTWIGPRNSPYADFPQPDNLNVRGISGTLGPGEGVILTRMRDSWGNLPEGPLGTPVKSVYAYGIVTYEDAFGKERFTRFCLIWDGRLTNRNGEQWGVLGTYSEGNDAT